MKNGFTLSELLIVIAIIGLLAALIIPSAVDNYKQINIKEMQTTENNISDTAKIFVIDYCKTSLGGNICPSTYRNSNYICLSDLVAAGYIEYPKYGETSCSGYISISGESYQTHLYCGTDYKTDDTTNKCN